MALARRQTNTKANKAILIGGGVLVALLLLLFLFSMGADKRAVQRVVDEVNVNYYLNKGQISKLVNLMERVNLKGCPSDFKSAYFNVIHTGRDYAAHKEDAINVVSGAYELGNTLAGGGDEGVALGLFGAFLSSGFAVAEDDEASRFKNKFIDAGRYLERVTAKYEVKM